jgi:phosphate-selective porin OprO/OprP
MAPETRLLNSALRFEPVNLKRGIALRRRFTPSPVAGLIFTALACALPPARIHASEASWTAAHSSSNSLSQTEAGPERLKQQVRVTVETNALPAGVATNAVTPREKSFQWNFSWQGWNGLHYDLSQRTRLTNLLAGVREKIEGTNGQQVSHPDKNPLAEFREKLAGTNTYRVFRLEELKMSGKIGAKIAVDGAAYVTDKAFHGFADGAEVRRARLYVKGDCLLLLPVSYELEGGYVPNQFYIENSYLALRDIPWIGDLKLGQYQAPMGLDVVTSSRDISLMEPAAPLQALAPGVSAGIQIGRPVFDQRATWKLGLFTEGVGSQDVGEAAKNYGRAITRLTGLPIYKADPDHPDSITLLHLGLSANILYSASGTVRYRSRPESHLAPYVIDTGDIAADNAMVAGAEAAWVNGPFSVQGEYLHSWVSEKNGQVPGFDGIYATASWFLTGESRPYDRQNGCFSRVIPRKNFDWGRGGWGAWEVAGRYSYVNLDNADIHGGRLSMVMAGVNWYLHSHAIWRFDYGFGQVAARQPEGNLNIFQTRFEVDF